MASNNNPYGGQQQGYNMQPQYGQQQQGYNMQPQYGQQQGGISLAPQSNVPQQQVYNNNIGYGMQSQPQGGGGISIGTSGNAYVNPGHQSGTTNQKVIHSQY